MRYPPDDTYKKTRDREANKGKDGKQSKQEEKTIEELIKEFEDDLDE